MNLLIPFFSNHLTHVAVNFDGTTYNPVRYFVRVGQLLDLSVSVANSPPLNAHQISTASVTQSTDLCIPLLYHDGENKEEVVGMLRMSGNYWSLYMSGSWRPKEIQSELVSGDILRFRENTFTLRQLAELKGVIKVSQSHERPWTLGDTLSLVAWALILAFALFHHSWTLLAAAGIARFAGKLAGEAAMRRLGIDPRVPNVFIAQYYRPMSPEELREFEKGQCYNCSWLQLDETYYLPFFPLYNGPDPKKLDLIVEKVRAVTGVPVV